MMLAIECEMWYSDGKDMRIKRRILGAIECAHIDKKISITL